MMVEKLVSISADFLYDGIVVPHNVYDIDAKVLLIRQGYTISETQLQSFRQRGLDNVLVSVETHKLLLENRLSCKVAVQTELEEKTGYTEVKDETLALLRDIENEHTVPQDTLYAVSAKLSNKLEITTPDLLLDLINALAPVDEYLQRHSVDVSLLNGLIGKWMNLPRDTVDLLVMIGLVHDCGKASIPPQILNAPRRLALAELEIIKMHPGYAYDMLAGFPVEVRYGARGHHEKYNSKGYPDAYGKEVIPLAARITAVSDIYNAMVSRRVYKDPRSPFEVISWLRKLSGTDLDPLIVDVFIHNMPKELLGKPVVLSDGKVGIIHDIDFDNLEYPYIRSGERVFKSDKDLFCTHMYFRKDS